jgi:hypothetical protein
MEPDDGRPAWVESCHLRDALTNDSVAPILLKKSFREAARNFSKPLPRG